MRKHLDVLLLFSVVLNMFLFAVKTNKTLTHEETAMLTEKTNGECHRTSHDLGIENAQLIIKNSKLFVENSKLKGGNR